MTKALRIQLLIALMCVAMLAYFVLLYANAPYTYFALFLALPAALITLTAKTPRELVLALQLTSLTALLYAVGVGWALAF